MITYPNGRKLHIGYASGDDDNLGRASFLADDNSGSPATPHLADYEYLGLGRTVEIDHGEPDLRFDLDHGTAGDYDGLDRFGRVVDLRWIDYGPNPDVEAVWLKYGYDEMGNRTYREDQAAIAASVNYFDELYDYDDVNRLTGLQRGNLNGTYDGLESLSKIGAEAWTHDATGNWKTYKQDTDSDAAWELEQARDHNKANEIDEDQVHGDPDDPITTTTGTNWVDPVQDAVGNMTKLPSPLSLTTGLDCTFDAWNRLVETDDGTKTTSFGYDGLNRRVILYDGTTPRYYFHSSRWQVIEERTGLSMVLDRQKVWGLGYVDELILRDRDGDSDTQTGDLGKTSSGLEERLYALQDANWNTVAIADTAGDVQQRQIYDAYGKVTRLNPTTFTTYTGTDYDWKTLYTGRCLDTETGLYYYRNRYYSAELGRFVTRDPSVYDGSPWNLYEYTHGRPEIFVDPSGRSTFGQTKPGSDGGLVIVVDRPTLLDYWLPAEETAGTCPVGLVSGPSPVGTGVGAAPGGGMALTPGQAAIILVAISADVIVRVCKYNQSKCKKQKRCRPCKPPVGTLGFRGPENGHAHFPFLPSDTHFHLYTMNQSPHPVCQCFWKRVEPDRYYTVAQPPLNAVPITNAAGGGPM